MRKLWLALLVTLVMLLGVTSSALAIDYRQGVGTRVEKTETVNDDLIIAGDTITIDGTVNGDVFAAANTVLVNGTINGNLFAAGNLVEIKGTVSGTAMGAANQVMLRGRVDRSLVAAGSRVIVEQDGSVGRSLIGAGDQIQQLGTVERGMTVGASRLMVNGRVGQELKAAGNTLELAPTAIVNGPFTYWSDNNAQIAEGAKVGQVVHNLPAKNFKFSRPGPWFLRPWAIALKFGGFLLVGLALLALFPRLRTTFPDLLERKPWQAPVAGFLALIAIPIAAVLLMITVIGLPVGLLSLVFYPVAIYLSQVLVSWAVGHFLTERVEPLKDQSWPVVFVLGALVTSVLIELPFVGGIMGAAAVFYGLGGLWFVFTERRQAV